MRKPLPTRRARRTLVAAAALSLGLIGASCSSETTPSPSANGAPGSAPTDAAASADTPWGRGAWNQVAGTDGRQYLADDAGRALQFRGVNIKTTDPDQAASDEVLDTIAARGFNHIRLSLYWSEAEPEQGTFDEAYLAAYDAAVDRAEARGLWVITSFHQDVFGPAFGDHGIPEWATVTGGKSFEDTGSFLTNYLQPAVQEAWENLYENPEVRDAQLAFVTAMAERMQAHPNVLGFDLLNEPFGKIREGEDLFTAAKRVEEEQITPMYQRLTDGIRTVDDQRWVFIEPPNLASLGVATSLGRIDDDRVVFYPHMYDPAIEGETYNGDGNPEAYDPAFFEGWVSAITTYTDRYPVPMMVGEWGLAKPENPGLQGFIATTLSTLESVTSGWTHFTGCLGESYCSFAEDGSDRPGQELLMQPYVSALAGTPDTSRWDPGTSCLTVRFSEPTEEASLLVIPEAIRYPDGWQLTAVNDTKPTVLTEADGLVISPGASEDGVVVVSVTMPPTDGPTSFTLTTTDGFCTV